MGITLNGEYYALERSRHRFSHKHCTEAHYNYTEFAPSYMNGMQKTPSLNRVTYKSFLTFVLDCSKKASHLKDMTVDVAVIIESTISFT